MIGDSITKYWNDPTSQTNESDLISAHLPGVLDAGVGGETCSQMLARFQHDVLDKGPSVVIIDCGTNDAALLHSYDMTPLFAMVDMAHKASVEVIVGTLPIADFSRIYQGSWTVIDEVHAYWNDQIRAKGSVGAKVRYVVADYYKAMLSADGSPDYSLLSADGVHPNSAGYAVMWQALSEVL